MKQSEKDEIIKSFIDGKTRYLIDTDVIAKGINN